MFTPRYSSVTNIHARFASDRIEPLDRRGRFAAAAARFQDQRLQPDLLTSPNGTNWTTQDSRTDEWLTDAAFLDARGSGVGTSGTVLTSTNLTAWTSIGMLTCKSLFGAATDSGQLVTVGVEGVILRNQIVPDRTPTSFVRYGRSSGRNVLLFGGKPGQRFHLERSPDLLHWLPGQDLEFIDGTGTLLFLEGFAPEVPQQFYRARLLP